MRTIYNNYLFRSATASSPVRSLHALISRIMAAHLPARSVRGTEALRMLPCNVSCPFSDVPVLEILMQGCQASPTARVRNTCVVSQLAGSALQPTHYLQARSQGASATTESSVQRHVGSHCAQLYCAQAPDTAMSIPLHVSKTAPARHEPVHVQLRRSRASQE